MLDHLEPVTDPEVRALVYRELPAYLERMATNQLPHVPTVDLFRSVSWGRLDLLREAIAAGGDVNHLLPPEACTPARGGTPVSWVASMGRMDLVNSATGGAGRPGPCRPRQTYAGRTGLLQRPLQGRRGAASGAPGIVAANCLLVSGAIALTPERIG